MNIIRISILIFSALLAGIFGFFGVLQGSSSDFTLLFMVFFFAANAFYVFYSRPTFVASEFFNRTATGLAIVTLELKHQAEEAKTREDEALRLEASEDVNKDGRLKAVSDFMKFAVSNPHLKKLYSFDDKTKLIADLSEKGQRPIEDKK
ncbi:hypothetical protein MKK64_00055 [Methylobacterium sp. E-025]|uniref:hypothetical protein n=1 Tax=Methylobacterium sp. E-025 TaxID=2836561 RepID=UPI001FB95C65|nr:hypothetical protein [Methylobacterium sp. E-025]MCJ2109626.1 hypothetical protein [Methylobacterium sp. E-025]